MIIKKSLAFAAMLTATYNFSVAQTTNAFPLDGNAGIGILNPTEKLDVRGNIYWDGFNSGNPRAVKIGYSGGNYGGIGYNMDFTSSTGIFNRPLNDLSSYLEFWQGGFKFYGISNSNAAQGINLNGSGDNLNLFATINRNGNLGIGTDNPMQKFVVSNNGAQGIEFAPGATINSSKIYAYNRSSNSHNSLIFHTTDVDFRNDLDISRLYIQNSSGNIGIGTTDPKGYKLAVAGNMIAESVKVQLQSTWPDYVFSKNYQLPTLQETEKHIKEKGHLPGIPSAEEVKANGIDVGEMNAKLLQKIEELTLHLIEMKKENKNLSERVNQLENKK